MKRVASLLLLLFTLLSLCAGCTTEKNFRDDTTPEALLENAEKKLHFEEGILVTEQSQAAIALAPGLSGILALSDRYILKDTAGESCDEYGIIHLTDRQNAETAIEAVKEYLAHKNKIAATAGHPDQEKLHEAEVHAFGSYIVFAAMTEENKAAFFSEIEQLLLEV